MIMGEADSDSDGKVTANELRDFMHTLMEVGEITEEKAWAVESMFAWADAEYGNWDQAFTMEEVKTGMNNLSEFINN